MTHDITMVGSGMGGMFTALALAHKGHRVTVFERDSVPPVGDADPLMGNLVQDHHPELRDYSQSVPKMRCVLSTMRVCVKTVTG